MLGGARRVLTGLRLAQQPSQPRAWHGSSAAAAAPAQPEEANTGVRRSRRITDDGRGLRDFLPKGGSNNGLEDAPIRPARSLLEEDAQPTPLRYHIKNYGCAMNHSDSEIVETLLREAGMNKVERPEDAEVLLLNTCAIRHNVENKVWSRLGHYRELRDQRKAWHRSQPAATGRNQKPRSAAAATPVIPEAAPESYEERDDRELREFDGSSPAAAAAEAQPGQTSEAAAEPVEEDDPDDLALASAAARGPVAEPPKQTVVGVLGCMAERVKEEFFKKGKGVDVVAGPDAYRDLPNLLSKAAYGGQTAINVQLSLEETYADVLPTVRTTGNSVSGFVSIMRGCDNMCAFCVVPQTRGRERSRDVDSILREVRWLSRQGYREVTLLGQNVNSYNDTSAAAWRRLRAAGELPEGLVEQGEESEALSGSEAVEAPEAAADAAVPKKVPLRPTKDALTPGFKNISRRRQEVLGFAKLLELVSAVDPNMRVRYTSPHPKDFPLELLRVVRQNPNICRQIHFPAQSGSTEVLKNMRRGYSRETYLELAKRLRDEVPGVALSTDMISGFSGETDADHQDTLTLMEQVHYEQAFMFKYSERPRTWAHRRLADDVPEPVKGRRLNEVIALFESTAQREAQKSLDRVECVLVDGSWRRDERWWSGRADSNRRVLFPPPGLDSDPLKEPPAAAGEAKPAEPEDSVVWSEVSVPLVLEEPVLDESVPPYQRLQLSDTAAGRPIRLGDYVAVRVTEASAYVFRGELLGILPGGVQQFAGLDPNHEYHLHPRAAELGLARENNPYFEAEARNLEPEDLEAAAAAVDLKPQGERLEAASQA